MKILNLVKIVILWMFVMINQSIFAQKIKSITDTSNTLNIAPYSKINVAKPSALLPLMQKRLKKIEALNLAKIPILLLENADIDQTKAMNACTSKSSFLKFARDSSGHFFLNEIFGVYPIRPGDLNFKPLNEKAKIYRIEMYNFALNLSTIGMYDIGNDTLMQTFYLQNTQPDISKSLLDLALEIASHAPDVIQALGYEPDQSEALMASTKTALNKTRCERSLHVCVAPTFIKDDKALWAIVDLTDLKIAGLKWTNVGTTGPALVTERKIQDGYIEENFCLTENIYEKDNWKLNYHLTSSDGLEIKNVFYKNIPILNSAKLVDWHVSYSSTEGYGYSDAIGCPLFSQATVYPNEAPKISNLRNEKNETIGFVLEQKYFNPDWPQPCNYNYVQRYEFYNDGSFRVSAASIGRGCGNDGTYRPVFRIAFYKPEKLYEWHENDWQQWTQEKWNLQEALTKYKDDKYQFKIDSKLYSYYLEPSFGQFNDGGRGDHAFTYATKFKEGEGDVNLITIGPCCNTDFRQGPEKFMESESIIDQDYVLWYVPQMKNDDRVGHEYCWAESVLENGIYVAKIYPCFSGPMFKAKEAVK